MNVYKKGRRRRRTSIERVHQYCHFSRSPFLNYTYRRNSFCRPLYILANIYSCRIQQHFHNLLEHGRNMIPPDTRLHLHENKDYQSINQQRKDKTGLYAFLASFSMCGYTCLEQRNEFSRKKEREKKLFKKQTRHGERSEL